MPIPGSSTLIAGTSDLGYYGQVDSASFISSSNLALSFGVTEGNVVENNTWLKFAHNGKTLFIPKTHIRTHISWASLYAAGLVYGTDNDGLYPAGTGVNQRKTIEIDGYIYLVRLLSGADADPSSAAYNTSNPSGSQNSEWAQLLLRTFSGDPNGSFWESFTAAEMGWGASIPANWCKENSVQFAANGTYRVTRGALSASSGSPLGFGYAVYGTISGGSIVAVWRPVLELIGPASNPAPPAGKNPKLPAVIPVSPFDAAPEGWTRTVFGSPGIHNFTPNPETTALYIVAVGGGGGGYVNVDGIAETVDTNGADTIVSDGTFEILKAAKGGGGASNVSSGSLQNLKARTLGDWIQQASFGYNVAGNSKTDYFASAAPAGGSSFGNGGASFTLPFVYTDTYNTFPFSSDSLSVSWTATSGISDTTGVVTKRFKLNGSFTVNYTLNNVRSSRERFQILVDGVILLTTYSTTANSGSSTASGSYTWTSTDFNEHTIEIRLLKTSTYTTYSGTASASITVSVANNANQEKYPLGASGAGGEWLHAAFLPSDLTITVGAGGIGHTDGIEIPSGAHGSFGGGGASGGNGGDGAVIIFQYSGELPLETVTSLELSYYNKASGVAGVYQSIYTSAAHESAPSVMGTVTRTHKLRPRTKTVIALIVGGGGGSCSAPASSVTSSTTAPAAKVSNSLLSVEARGGSSSRISRSGTEVVGYTYYDVAGSGGSLVDSTIPPVLSRTSQSGTTGSVVKTSDIFNNYGAPGVAVNTSTYSGGFGAYCLVVIGSAYFENERTLDVIVPGGSSGAYTNGRQGAVILYETEQDIGNLVSQNGLLTLLHSNDYDNVNVSQAAITVLQESAITPNRVSQAALMVLVKSPDEPTQVSESVIQVVFEEPLAPIRVSNTGEYVLSESKVNTVRVTNTSEYIAVESKTSAIRVSNTAQYALISLGLPELYISQAAALALLREEITLLRTINFGVLEYPEKFTLYETPTRTLEGAYAGVFTIQLEGYLPEGTTIILNGVDMQSLTVEAQIGDTVKLRSGVSDWFTDRITLYSYMEISEGNIRKDYAGIWTVLQHELAPAKRAIIGEIVQTYPENVEAPTFYVDTYGVVQKAMHTDVDVTPVPDQNDLVAIQTYPVGLEIPVYPVGIFPVPSQNNIVLNQTTPNVVGAPIYTVDVLPIKYSLNASPFDMYAAIATLANQQYVNTEALATLAHDTYAQTYAEITLANVLNVQVYPEAAKTQFAQVYTSSIVEKYHPELMQLSAFTKELNYAFLHNLNILIAHSRTLSFEGSWERTHANTKDFDVYSAVRQTYRSASTGISFAEYRPINIFGPACGYTVYKLDKYANADQAYFRMRSVLPIGVDTAMESTSLYGPRFVDVGYLNVRYNGVDIQLNALDGIQKVVTTEVFPTNRREKLALFNLVALKRLTNYLFVDHNYDWHQSHETSPVDHKYTDGKPVQGSYKSATYDYGKSIQRYYTAQIFGAYISPQRYTVDQSFDFAKAATPYNAEMAFTFRHSSNGAKTLTYWELSAVIGTARAATEFKSTSRNVVSTEVNWVVRLQNNTLLPVAYAVTKMHQTKVKVTPILGQPGKNKVDSATYYSGFASQAEVIAFVENFLNPSTKQKLDGWIYRVDTDDTLVCEIAGAATPIAWLLRGG